MVFHDYSHTYPSFGNGSLNAENSKTHQYQQGKHRVVGARCHVLGCDLILLLQVLAGPHVCHGGGDGRSSDINNAHMQFIDRHMTIRVRTASEGRRESIVSDSLDLARSPCQQGDRG